MSKVISTYFRCYLRLGDWQENLQGINEASVPQVIQWYSKATEHDKNWYKVTRQNTSVLTACFLCLYVCVYVCVCVFMSVLVYLQLYKH